MLFAFAVMPQRGTDRVRTLRDGLAPVVLEEVTKDGVRRIECDRGGALRRPTKAELWVCLEATAKDRRCAPAKRLRRVGA